MSFSRHSGAYLQTEQLLNVTLHKVLHTGLIDKQSPCISVGRCFAVVGQRKLLLINISEALSQVFSCSHSDFTCAHATAWPSPGAPSKDYTAVWESLCTVFHTKTLENTFLNTWLIFSKLSDPMHICIYHHEGLSFGS